MKPWTALVLTCSLAGTAAAMDAMDILARADAIRFPAGDHETQATVTFIKPDRPHEVATYNILMKGNDQTIIQTLQPASMHGTSYLMVRRDLWIFAPDAAMPVRVSFQQRLFGDVANADLARPNFVGDYTPTLTAQSKKYYVLSLAAKSEDVPYHRILLAVEKGTFRPYKAQFFAESGKLLKIGLYDDYQQVAGDLRPMRLSIDNPLVKGQKTIIVYKTMETRDLSPKLFTKDYLKKWKY